MMTSPFRFEIAAAYPGMASREMGREALVALESALAEHDSIELDFNSQNPSPSFVDETVGTLVFKLGYAVFREKIKLRNVADSSLPLIRHVIFRRIQLAAQTNPTLDRRDEAE